MRSQIPLRVKSYYSRSITVDKFIFLFNVSTSL